MNDYGLINSVQTGYDKTYPKHTQVFQATHNGEGLYLPHMNRSFMSFSFSDKPKNGEKEEKRVYIEDFNLIATIDGDRLQRKGYSEFEDLTSNYEVLDGHFYWGTHYTNHTLDFNLATDGMTENELNNFLKWFQPGKTRELILSEHPNRAIMARVSASPELHLFPFEEKTVKKIAGQEYKTSTTLYKGEISLSFTMEEPYWYSKINIFGYFDGQIYHDVWIDTNNKEVNIFNDPDAIKIALEDNIPIAGMIDASMLLGNNTFADADTATSAATAAYDLKGDNVTPFYTETETQEVINGKTVNVISVLEEEYIEDNARIAYVENEGTALEKYIYGARLSGAIMSESTGIENFAANSSYYFYYAGNAPSKPIIEFILTPVISNSTYYIINPKNKYALNETDNADNIIGNPYNVFSFESLNKKELQFTTPSVYTAYNQVIDIFNKMSTNTAWVQVRKDIRDYVNHPAARAWANKVIDSFEGNTVGENITLAKQRMRYFLQKKNSEDLLDATFSINSKTGRAIGTIGYRIPEDYTPLSNEWASYGAETINEQEEDVGDMIRSNYLLIEDQNQPNDDGHIKAWANTSETTRVYSHVIRHDVANGLKNVFVKYQNMYL